MNDPIITTELEEMRLRHISRIENCFTMSLDFPGYESSNTLDMSAPETEVWYLCVSISDGYVCAELSRLKTIENSQFKEFSERIFILRPGEYPLHGINYDEVLNVESGNVEVDITRKQEIQSN